MFKQIATFSGLMIALVLCVGCGGAIEPAGEPAGECPAAIGLAPNCGPGGTEATVLSTPRSTTCVGPELEDEYRVYGCVEIPDRSGYAEQGRTWCCWSGTTGVTSSK